MKTPTKKSSVEKSKSKKKSPLLKYQTAGFGGSDSYSGFDARTRIYPWTFYRFLQF
jgi:hypothetical protein